ncbi:polysaccharide biosynthesis protein [Isoalcanivorax indicus]|uniref:polysaccharide biosynthesis protein n=1 Tax=Isoalcanivorax indicus TaxID=2202653 RepID=UPI001FE77051|nr:nucleoside-diphosphate sugar epimerase/dehydratase [Isoalcanivorax indicus]
MVLADLVALPLVFVVAYAVRVGDVLPTVAQPWLILLAPLITVPFLYVSGLYRAVVRYLGGEAAIAIFTGMAMAAVVLAASGSLLGLEGTPRSVFIIYAVFGMLWLGASRFLVRRYLFWALHVRERPERVAIFGAGTSGIQLAMALANGRQYSPTAFVDDQREAQGSLIQGLPVLNRQGLHNYVKQGKVETVLLAMPSATRAQRLRVITFLEKLPVKVKSVPSMCDIVSGKASIEQIRDVAIEDLLGRDPVPPQGNLLGACIAGRNVLVTGAGGSIGSELCRQIIQLNPRRLVLVEHNEFGLYSMERELTELAAQQDIEIVAVLGSVVARGLLESVCRRYGIQTLYHAAAYKHVPIVEMNPSAGVRNNIIGTFSAAEAAENAGVERFILVSTDKAVRPTNVMGATKRFAELILQGMALRGSNTVFSMVRFGNVLGSSGSVVPLFREQIRQGGPVTVTHPEVTRYFMTIPEASQLVIQAGSMAEGGEVFVLDMGEPVRIFDLATAMIHLMGYSVRDEQNPLGDIEIHFSGLRPGEKLYEELLFGDDGVGTRHPMIMQAREEAHPWAVIEKALDQFRIALEVGDEAAMRQLLRRYVMGYAPAAHDQPELPAAPSRRDEVDAPRAALH